MKRYIIDGYNVLHKTSININRRSLEISRESLENLVEASSLYGKSHVTIVYDGRGIGVEHFHKSSKMTICFSASGQTADSVIKDMIDDVEGNKNVVVVSSDRSVSDYARVSGVAVLKAEEFLETLEETKAHRPKHTKDKIVSEQEVQEWKKLFEQ